MTTLCLLYDAPASMVGGAIRVHRVYGSYVDALAPYFDQIVVCNTLADFDLPEAQYEFRAANVSFVALPYYSRVTGSSRVLPECAKVIWQASGSWDVIYITLPSPLGIIGYLVARTRKIPVVLDVEGDLETQYEAGRYRGVSRLASYGAVRLFEWSAQWMVDRSVTITQGEALFRKHKRNGNHVLNIPWSPMSRDAIVQREDTCQELPVRLLFVGALLEKKGIFVLLDAVRLLLKEMSNFIVTYVGTGPFADELSRRVRDSGVSEYIRLRGGVYVEVDLLREFDAADLFVFPTYAEGFPRVIFEAMARGLPVIASRVSGIPGVVIDGRDALLVSPGSPREVAEAVLRIVRDPILRMELIRNGRRIAEEYTVEKTTENRAKAIRLATEIT